MSINYLLYQKYSQFLRRIKVKRSSFFGCTWWRRCNVEEMCFGTSILEQTASHVSQVDPDNGKRISARKLTKKVFFVDIKSFSFFSSSSSSWLYRLFSLLDCREHLFSLWKTWVAYYWPNQFSYLFISKGFAG